MTLALVQTLLGNVKVPKFSLISIRQCFGSCHPTFTDKKFVDRWLQFDSRIHSCKNVTISLRVSLTRLGQVIKMQPSGKFFAKLACHLVLQICDRGYLDAAIAKNFAKLAYHLVLQICNRGFLDAAIAKKCKTRMPSCAIYSQQRLFRCSHHKKIICRETRKKIQKFVSETCEKQSQEYFVCESRGAPFDCFTTLVISLESQHQFSRAVHATRFVYYLHIFYFVSQTILP